MLVARRRTRSGDGGFGLLRGPHRIHGGGQLGVGPRSFRMRSLILATKAASSPALCLAAMSFIAGRPFLSASWRFRQPLVISTSEPDWARTTPAASEPARCELRCSGSVALADERSVLDFGLTHTLLDRSDAAAAATTRSRAQISICVPSSTTLLAGRLK